MEIPWKRQILQPSPKFDGPQKTVVPIYDITQEAMASQDKVQSGHCQLCAEHSQHSIT